MIDPVFILLSLHVPGIFLPVCIRHFLVVSGPEDRGPDAEPGRTVIGETEKEPVSGLSPLKFCVSPRGIPHLPGLVPARVLHLCSGYKPFDGGRSYTRIWL